MNNIALGASAPVSAHAELSDEISISLHESGAGAWTEFRGTRAQIEAEGLVPPSTQWPASGYSQSSWDDGAVLYLLRRVRPLGAKGPRRAFAQIDHWSLRTVLLGVHWTAREIALKRSELQAIVHRVSPQGRAEWNAHIHAHAAAQSDQRFGAFLGQITGRLAPRQSKGAAA